MFNYKENSQPLLTIGYATHNRKKLILKRLKEIIKLCSNFNIEFIIIDNASTDNTYEELTNTYSGKEIHIYKNSENLGFSGNVIEIINKANGKFVMWVSDEDKVSENKILEILNYLESNNSDAIVLNHYKEINNSLHPIRINSSRLIKIKDLWKTSHLPGIIWNRNSINKFIIQWSEFKNSYPEISRYYPNLIFMVYLIPKANSFFYDNYLSFQKDFMPSQHTGSSSNGYPTLIPRWRQHNEILKLIDHNYNINDNQKEKKLLKKMKVNLNRNIFSYISNALYEENKEVYYHFSRSFYPSYLIERNFNFIILAVKFIIRSPYQSLKIIKKRLKAFYGMK